MKMLYISGKKITLIAKKKGFEVPLRTKFEAKHEKLVFFA